MKQSATLGHMDRYVQLIPAAPLPVHQVVLKPADADPAAAKSTTVADNSAASPTRWRPVRPMPAKIADKTSITPVNAKPADESTSDALKSTRSVTQGTKQE